MARPRSHGLFALLALVALLVACASERPVAEPRADLPRHTELVQSTVLRDVAGEPRVALDHAEEVAIVAIAEALDSLEAEVVAGFRLDVSTTLVIDAPDRFQVKALVAVHTLGPPEQMRAMLQGRGTVQRGTNCDNDLRLATRGAVRAAMRRLLEICRRFS